MPTGTINHTSQLYVQECCNCHVLFGMPTSWDKALRETHATFYCPAGHGQSYTGPTKEQKALAEVERLRRALAEEQVYSTAKLDQLQATQRSLAATKGVNTRMKNRIAAGVCPCCNRAFQNVARHMAGQHPDFATSDETAQ